MIHQNSHHPHFDNGNSRCFFNQDRVCCFRSMVGFFGWQMIAPSGNNYMPLNRQLLQSDRLVSPMEVTYKTFSKITYRMVPKEVTWQILFFFALPFWNENKKSHQPEFQPASLIAPSTYSENKVFSDVAGGIYRLKLSNGCWKQFVHAQLPGKFCEFVTLFLGDGENVSIFNGENVTSNVQGCKRSRLRNLGSISWISIGRCMTIVLSGEVFANSVYRDC